MICTHFNNSNSIFRQSGKSKKAAQGEHYSFKNCHVWTLALHNAAVPLGVQQMETFTKLSFNPHHASTPMGECLCCVSYKEKGLISIYAIIFT